MLLVAGRALEAPDVGSVSASSSGLLAVPGPRRGQPGGAAVQPTRPDARCGERVAAPVTGAQEREMCLVGWGLALGPHWGLGLGRRAALGEGIRWTGTWSLGLGRSLWCPMEAAC